MKRWNWAGLSKRAVLAAEIVAQEEHVEGVGGRRENPPADGRIVVDEVRQQRVDQFRRVVHLQIEVLHSQQINRVVPERRPIAAENRVPAIPGQRLGTNPRNVLPLRIGPRVIFDLSQRGVGQRVSQGLTVAVPRTLDAEEGPRRGPGCEGDLGAGVAGKDAAEIVAEADQDALGVGQVQLAPCLGEKFRRRAAPPRHSIRLLVREGG